MPPTRILAYQTQGLQQELQSGVNIKTINGASLLASGDLSLLASLNGLTANTQSFSTGKSGSDFGISSSGSVHTFNLPDAGPSARGLVTTGNQTFAGAKTFSSAATFSQGATFNGTTTHNANSTYKGNIIFDNRQVTSPATYPSPAWGFEWLISSDGAGMIVYERGTDSLDYVFTMRDNVNSGDRYLWRETEWRGHHATYEAMELYPGGYGRINQRLEVAGRLQLKNPSLHSVLRRRSNSQQAYTGVTIVRNNQDTADPNLNGSTLTMEVDVSGYTGIASTPYIIKIKDATSSPNTFCWGTGSHSNDVNVTGNWSGNDIAVSTSWITLSNGVRIRFNATTGGVANETFGFTVQPGGGLYSDWTGHSYFAGNLVIGATDNQGYKADIRGTLRVTGVVTVQNTLSSSKLIVGSTTDAGYMADIHGNTMVRGDITATGNIQGYATSDERLKRGIQRIADPLAMLERIEGVRFDWKPEYADLHPFRGPDVGLLAQQVREVLPEAVGQMGNGYLGVKYERLIPVLVEALKELKQEVETLKRS